MEHESQTLQTLSNYRAQWINFYWQGRRKNIDHEQALKYADVCYRRWTEDKQEKANAKAKNEPAEVQADLFPHCFPNPPKESQPGSEARRHHSLAPRAHFK